MIIAGCYEGDDDIEVMRQQHDVYDRALGIIIGSCNRLTMFARWLLDARDCPDWGNVDRCDHRTLQNAHDILAAAWRFKHELRQADLPLEAKREMQASHTPEKLWLWWLQDEIDGWVQHPSFVRNVQIILSDQNEPPGFLAETRLCLGLMDHFHDVPWYESKRQAFEKDLDADLQRLAPSAG
jgi:hypothetical protein